MNCRNYVTFTAVFYYIGDDWRLLWWWWYNISEPSLNYPSANSVKIVFHNARLAHKHTYVYVDLKKYGVTISAWYLWEHRFFLTAPQWARSSSFLRFLDHTQRRTTVGRTPLDERSPHTHNRQTSMPPVGFEPTTPAGERPQTYALDRAATGTGRMVPLVDVNSVTKLLWSSLQKSIEVMSLSSCACYCNMIATS